MSLYVTNSTTKPIAWDGIVDKVENLPPADAHPEEVFLVTGGNTTESGIFISKQGSWEPIPSLIHHGGQRITEELQLDKFEEVSRTTKYINVPDNLGNPSDVYELITEEITFINPFGITLKLRFKVPDGALDQIP